MPPLFLYLLSPTRSVALISGSAVIFADVESALCVTFLYPLCSHENLVYVHTAAALIVDSVCLTNPKYLLQPC
jgi:hypothetical protein